MEGFAYGLTVDEKKVRETFAREGAPFLIGSQSPMAVGERFMLAGNAFVVVRMITRSEFEHNAGRRRLPSHEADYFFEAVTD
jgi:hypothetical protein